MEKEDDRRMVLVTGAGGQVGCAILHAFAQKNIKTRAFIHRAETMQKVLDAGADDVFIGDMDSENDLRAAMKSVGAVYFICSAANPNEDKIGQMMINAAKEFDNKYFVYHSVLHSVLRDMPHHEKKMNVEKMLVDSGLEFTIVQPAVFMQMLLPAVKSVKSGGPLLQKFFASKDTRMNLIDMDDMAEAAAVIMSSRSYVNATLELCGRDNYSLLDVQSAFSHAAGRDVEACFIPDEIFLKQADQDADSYSGQTLLRMFQHYNRHSFCGNCFVVSQILGREPRGLAEFVMKSFENEI